MEVPYGGAMQSTSKLCSKDECKKNLASSCGWVADVYCWGATARGKSWLAGIGPDPTLPETPCNAGISSIGPGLIIAGLCASPYPHRTRVLWICTSLSAG